MSRLSYLLLRIALVGGAVAQALSSSSMTGPTQPPQQPLEPSNRASQIMQGTGPNQVDLNQYNLESPERIQEEWTANLKQKVSEKKVRVELGVQSDRELYVDTVEVVLPPRQKGQGLGIELVELRGGREDGLGITLVSGLVPGGPAEGTDIRPGDSIAKVTLLRKRRNDGLDVREQAMPVSTECLGYDATVDAILGLPPVKDEFEDKIVLSLKRIRRKPKVTVKLQYPPQQEEKDATIELFAGENLRMGMLVRGLKLNDPRPEI